mgnify:CR=1 FL=1
MGTVSVEGFPGNRERGNAKGKMDEGTRERKPDSTSKCFVGATPRDDRSKGGKN